MGLLFLQKVNPVKMKVFLLSATLALASASFAPSCEECNAARVALLARLTSPESIAEQTGILISQWWGDMANCLFPALIGVAHGCEHLGLCKVKSGLGDWTCDDCTDIITRVAAFMVKPETIEQGLAVLNGECFCGAEGHTAECPDLVASLAEPAMQVLSAVLMETTPELCQDIVGVC